jgi:hypothetical protein
MTPEEARTRILGSIKVTPQMVVLAKRTISSVAGHQSGASMLIDAVLRENGIAPVKQVIVHPNYDTESECTKAAAWISWEQASAEAIWSLVSTGLLLPSSQSLQPRITGLAWTTIVPGSGSGTSSGWSGFDAVNLPIPASLTRAPSQAGAIDQQLSDADLYLKRIDIPSMDIEVEAALREAVACLRYGLHSAAVAMLGKASEGAWIELGSALLDAAPSSERNSLDAQRRTH